MAVLVTAVQEGILTLQGRDGTAVFMVSEAAEFEIWLTCRPDVKQRVLTQTSIFLAILQTSGRIHTHAQKQEQGPVVRKQVKC